MPETPEEKSIRLKYGICNRCYKEWKEYVAEKTKEEEKLDKLKKDKADAHAIQQQTDVVAETNLVIPDSRARLERAYQEFKEVMDQYANSEQVNGTEQYKKAKALLDELTPILEDSESH